MDKQLPVVPGLSDDEDELDEDDDDEDEEPAPVPGSKVKALSKHLQELVALLPLNVEVHRSTIEASYKRSNYARRIRKIVSEYGWDIESFRGSKGANDDRYIRRSEGPVRPQRIRKEVSPKTRKIIYERDAWKCQLCGTSVAPEQTETNPQCDHKVPADRGGPSSAGNLQTLCMVCNLKKRQACNYCTLPTCNNCPLAFPEKFADAITLRLSQDAADKLNTRAQAQGIPINLLLEQMILDSP